MSHIKDIMEEEVNIPEGMTKGKGLRGDEKMETV